jgi:hypothetical protein
MRQRNCASAQRLSGTRQGRRSGFAGGLQFLSAMTVLPWAVALSAGSPRCLPTQEMKNSVRTIWLVVRPKGGFQLKGLFRVSTQIGLL